MICPMDMAGPPTETCVTRAWRVHQREIEGYLRHRLGDGEQAADLLQTVFLKALHEGRRFCELREPRAWLFAVARNALADHLRLRPHHEPLPDDIEAPTDEPAPVDTLADCLPAALAALDPDDRDILTQCDLQGMTQKDYASRHGLSLAAAKSRVLRARARLRALLVSTCGVRFDAATGRVCCALPPQTATCRPSARAAA